LDGVRGLAIVMVLATHFVGGSAAVTVLQKAAVKAAGYGVLGVDLFFVLSGFLITGLLLRAKGKPHYFRNFYARRTLRIFPLYFGVLVVLFLLLPRFVTLSPMLQEAARHQAWLWTYTSNFYIARIASWDSLTYVNHFWSLAIEEHFYLLWPLIVFAFDSRALTRICVGVLAGGLVLRSGLAMAGVNELSISVLTPCRVDTLCTGALLALMLARAPRVESLFPSARRLAGLLAGAVLAVSAWCALTDIWVPTLHQVRNSLYAGLFAAVIVLSLDQRSGLLGRLFHSRILQVFGRYSYGLYVYHAILLWGFMEYGVERRLDTWLNNHTWTMVVIAILGTGVSFGVAVLSYELVEARFLALKRFFETVPPGSEARLAVAAGSGRSVSLAGAQQARD
jgi:peptidoglycan/LPS O-acetylase OafA/YrhL